MLGARLTQPVIMWFRQDLRLADNPALSAAAAAGQVMGVYILDDDTPGAWRWGGASRWWLHHSLKSLCNRLPIVLRKGKADAVLAALIRESGATALYFTRDYAPWSGALEQRVRAICEKAGVDCHRYGGFLLHEPEAIRTGAGEPYKVFTPFSRAAFAKQADRRPRPAPRIDIANPQIASDRLADWNLLPARPNWAAGFASVWAPGEEEATARLERFIESSLAGYADGRDRPDRDSTSRLSPHLHWGEISPLQCWQAVRSAMDGARGALDAAGEKFLKELLWREFSYHLIHHWPDLPEKAFRPEFDGFPWRSDDRALHAWREGRTGYPLVDAGMRELWATGYMHNRVRMIVASFLIKHLLLPWQEGEKWFWDTLVDADIANNAASWQWVAGSGADAAPYFRIFNPVLQAERFDPNGDYVRKWVPELADRPASIIHRPWQAGGRLDYPAPIVEHDMARKRALAALKTIKQADA
ncbi:MAG: deoxyribodipyrimidine photo-lyase [Rhizobiales bacterium]|nr:deoxyribodipyrimidine photo-lyase [Hyphomicrobiales bacterium]